ncbi:MAG: tRNA (adenosine(37)-N6)-dimethylallyltransferase MiaA [Candidatus Caenarcaniphilales bacterium]|nr:tRNA (adenosine(37)-N6)-dimethylallyltransferase MiaA [Candidatus Caenarcaniphilales bacterium]
MECNSKKYIIAIVGPTAVGKSALAIDLASCLQSEIISADSRLVYKKMDIGTAKPTLKERKGIKHHLIDVLEPNEEVYSLGRFVNEAEPLIKSIIQEGKTPVVVGGTGFYFKGLLEKNPVFNVEPNHIFRQTLEKFSTEELYNKLKETSTPEHTWGMSPNDRYRIIRALEIENAFSNKDFHKKINKKNFEWEVLWFGLKANNRNFLKEKISHRIDLMLKSGLIDEVKTLIEEYGELEIFKKTIGYSETINYLNKEISKEELKSKIAIATNQYSKRQMTWFKANKKIIWFDCFENKSTILEEIHRRILEKFSKH